MTKPNNSCCEKCSGYFPHTIGSHSDDRGGDSDYPCYCNENNCRNPKCECHKPNNSWEIEFDNRDLGCCGGDSCPHYVVRQDENGNNVGTNHDEVLKDFITKTLQQQREEDIKNICKGVDKIINDNVVPEIGSINYPRIILMLDKYLQSLKQENK